MSQEVWRSILEVMIIGLLVYPGLILVLRITGKRTLSKMNAFDLVVTIALGSTLSSTLLSSSVSLWKGFAGLIFLIAAQFSVTWLSVRSATFRRMIRAEPTILYHKGVFLEPVMKRERVSKDEILAAMRTQGQSELSKVYAVVLETEGTLSVLSNAGDALESVGKPKP